MPYCTCDDLKTDIREFDFLHSLSHISQQFTAEFGKALWKDAIINFRDPGLFFVFFEDLPEILKHVKGLILSINYNYGNDFDTSGSLLLNISEFVSRRLDLQLFAIHLFTDWGRDSFTQVQRIGRLGHSIQELGYRGPICCKAPRIPVQTQPP